MKTIKGILTVTFLTFILNVSAQQVEGELTINNDQRTYIKIGDIKGESNVINLLKAFRDGDYKIKFNFGGKYPPQQKPEFSFFRFKTTVKHNGKTIKTIVREPTPYIPGDMFLPAEVFDFVHILSTYKQEGMAYMENTGKMPNGDYEIVLEAIPVKTEGRISKGIIMFNIK